MGFPECGLAGLSGLLAHGEISSAEITAHFLERIAAENSRLNAFVTLNEQAMDLARASDTRRAEGRALGLLDGLPIAVKDNILTGGLRTTLGSPVYGDFVPERDEVAVARLKAGGAIVLGKTNVPEFTLEGFTDNALFGPTRNPWDERVTPGGSSGGSVAGVAAGLAPGALGTDGGGSIRRPAGYTGLVGLKPTIGRIARAETLPQTLFDMEVIGPIARSVADAAMLFEAMEGAFAGDPRSWLQTEPGRQKPLEDAPPQLRILYVEKFGDAPLDPVIAGSCRAVASQLSALGHAVETGILPFDIGRLNEQWPMVGQAGLAFLADNLGGDFEKASEKYREMAARGRAIDAGTLFGLFDLIAGLRRAAAMCFGEWDMIVTPASAAMPWPIGIDYPPEIDGHMVGPRGHAIYTAWVNAIGHPAISLPGPPSPAGMPIGTQIVAAHNRDWQLLRLARQFE